MQNHGPGTVQSNYIAQYKVDCSIDGTWSFELGANSADATITADGKLTAKQARDIAAAVDAGEELSTPLPRLA